MNITQGGFTNDFIEPNRKQYIVPVYQRNYEWSKEQCERLFKDIIIAYRRDKFHFTGSFVYAPLKNEDKIDYYVIIDGQQRMTTLFILIKALIDLADTDAEKDTLSKIVFNEDKFKQYDFSESSKLKLKPVKSDDQQLALLMEDKVESMNTESGIYKNYKLFCDLIRKTMKEENIGVEQIYGGIENLTCACIKLEKDDNPQEIFEGINSTGIPLNLADKIRNYVLMVDVDQDNLYDNYWLPAETAVNKDKMTDFFLDYLNMKIDGFARENVAYDVFKTVFEEGNYTNKSILEEILHYANFYKVFLYGDESYSKKVNEYLADLQKLKQTTVFLFLFHVFDDYNDGIIDERELEKVLEFLRNYSIRRIICEINSSSLRGLYKTLYTRIFNNEENKNHYYDSIVSFFTQLNSKDALPTDEEFIAALEQKNLYRKNALCKYLLIAIENQGKEKLEQANLSIEHILPQNENLSTAWQNMLGENWQEVKNTYLHTLGNLTLTGYNSELGDKPFSEKKQLLEDAQTKIIALNKYVMSKDVWNEEAIKERAQQLSNKIIELFPINSPNTKIEFKDPRYKEYTCENSDSATNKTPNYFILCGERVNCSTFADMLKLVVVRLYERDDSIIKNMARDSKNSQNISLFSYEQIKPEQDYQIPGTDIYEYSGYSAYSIITIIRDLLDRYDIEHDDFVYSARPYKKESL